jgi:hypothetical protein
MTIDYALGWDLLEKRDLICAYGRAYREYRRQIPTVGSSGRKLGSRIDPL